jgi:hypothetical protein
LTSRTPKPEEFSKNISEIREVNREVRACSRPTNAGMPVAVIGCSPLSIGQDRIGLVDFLEAFLRIWGVVHIRVILAREPAKCPFEVIIRGIPPNS